MVASDYTINGSVSESYLRSLNNLLLHHKNEDILGYVSKFKPLSAFEQYMNSRLYIYLNKNNLTLQDIGNDLRILIDLLYKNSTACDNSNIPSSFKSHPAFLEIYSGLKFYHHPLENSRFPSDIGV